MQSTVRSSVDRRCGLPCPSPRPAGDLRDSLQLRNSNFWEQTGVGWGFNAKGISFGFGGANPGVPQFGGYQPNGLMGDSFGGGDFRGYINFAFGQGSQTSLVNRTPDGDALQRHPRFLFRYFNHSLRLQLHPCRRGRRGNATCFLRARGPTQFAMPCNEPGGSGMPTKRARCPLLRPPKFHRTTKRRLHLPERRHPSQLPGTISA